MLNTKLAFLFPGQGSQSVGMGKDLAAAYSVAQQTFDEADAALGYKLSQLCFEGPEEKLKLTEITQPAILTVSVAAFRVLREKGIVPAFVAGHSLGEYSAHVAAGTLNFADAIRAVCSRGKYMQEAVPVGEGAMAAILGMASDEVRRVCQEAAQDGVCSPANLNSPDQTVISGSKSAVELSGSKSAVERAAELAKSRDAKKAVMLAVSAPFHCALMQPAQVRLAEDLRKLNFQPMQVPLIKNIDAEPTSDPINAREALIHQVTGAVQWVNSMRKLIELGAEAFVEVGPGKVLSGLMRQIDRSQSCLNVEDEASLQKTMPVLALGS
ncbi:MAG: [acyl-carrier-protein] S-malonyltransferase [Acidobacteria bacterium]|nr:MAG: [acyl-carrier-protein] S-malonyltransferase [Acidobacteriota bacterium]